MPAIFITPPARPAVRRSAAGRGPAPVELTIDGAEVTRPGRAPRSSTPAAPQGIDTPTLCYAENLTPVNVCRVCVVEVDGSRVARARVLPQGRSRGWTSRPTSERVRHSRRLVLEFLGSSVDLSLAGPAHPDGSLAAYAERYGADPARFGPPRAAGRRRRARRARPGHHHAPTGPRRPRGDRRAAGEGRQRPLRPRLLASCILCYKCVEACGEDAQNTFAIAVAGRGFDARISTEWATPLPDSACVYCGNCIGVCPTGALMFKSRARHARRGHAGTSRAQTVTDTICPYCGVGCTLDLHVQDNAIVKVTSPLDSSVTEGHLCIKGRFGFEFVNERRRG